MNLDTPKFEPGLLYVRDDIMENQSLGVFYDAPGWKNEDFYAFLLIQRIFGNWSQESYYETMIDVKS